MQVRTSAPPRCSNTLPDLRTASQPQQGRSQTSPDHFHSHATLYVCYYATSVNSNATTVTSAHSTSAVDMVPPGPGDCLEQTQDDDDRLAPPSSAQASTSQRVTKSHTPVSPTKAAPARRTFFDPWNSSSTGHQRAENRLSGSTSWRVSRSLKLGEQYKGGLSGGKRVQDTVGAGSEDFGKDGRKENGGWEKGAKGLRTGGQQSLAEVWSVSKVGKKSKPEKHISQAEDSPEEVQGMFVLMQAPTCVFLLGQELDSRLSAQLPFAFVHAC